MSKRDIVVVGASAGGVEALTKLVSGLPENFDAAVFIVLHIPAHSPSQLHEILNRCCKSIVAPAIDGEVIKPGRIYVAPADRHLMCDENCVRLTRGPKENRVRPAVDVLFRSAAYSFGPRAIGVVLSGMLDDGTAGLWAIKDRGGIAVVQAPEDALYPSMPESALAQVDVDHTLPLHEMPDILSRLTEKTLDEKKIKPAGEWLQIENKIALEGNALKGGIMKLGQISPNTCPECHGVLVRIQQGPIRRFRCHTGHSFSMQTLLADVNVEIDNTLWGAVRSIEERILLLQEMRDNLGDEGNPLVHQDIEHSQTEAENQVQKIREMLLSRSYLGHIPVAGDHRKSA